MIALYTPYGRNEVTGAALALADLLCSFGLEVRVVSIGLHEGRVHDFWDSRVELGRGDGVHRASLNAKWCIWFASDRKHRREAVLVAPLARHILVPSWHSATAADLDTCNHIVFPSKTVHQAVASCAPPADKLRYSHVLWDSGLPPVLHNGRIDDNRVRLLAYCDNFVIDGGPSVAVLAIDRILTELSNVVITAYCTKSWDRWHRRKIRGMLTRYRGRFRIAMQRSWSEQATVFHEHDWFMCLSPSSNYGLAVSRALSCGLPVLCYDVPPFNERVKHNVSGRLLSCEALVSSLGAVTAAAVAETFVTAAVELFSDVKLLLRFQNTEWNLCKVATRFREFWLNALSG